MDPTSIALLIVTAIRAGVEVKKIFEEVAVNLTPEERVMLVVEMDQAVADWRKM